MGYNPQSYGKIFSDAREGSSIEIFENFSKVEVGAKEPLLRVFSPYSVLRVSIMKTLADGQKQINVSNIKLMECCRLIENSRTLREKVFMEKSVDKINKQEQTASAAPQAKFITGTFAGMTPAELLTTGKATQQQLLSQKEFLQKNLDRYPKNAALIKSIDDAISGKAQACGSTSVNLLKEIKNESESLRFMAKDVKNGKTRIYTIKITADISSEEVRIDIMNCYAPLQDTSNGRLKTIVMAQAEDKRVMNWTIPWEAWTEFMRMLEWDINSCVSAWQNERRERSLSMKDV